MTINSQLTFAKSSSDAPDKAVKIPVKNSVNFYETLCKYCADNNINLDSVSDFDFNEAVETIDSYNHNSDYDFYFWIDEQQT